MLEMPWMMTRWMMLTIFLHKGFSLHSPLLDQTWKMFKKNSHFENHRKHMLSERQIMKFEKVGTNTPI